MAITDIDDLTRPLSDLVGEQGEKAAKRKKQLAEVRATRAAGMTADEAKAAAERGDFPGVAPSRVRGPLDLDEDIDQDTGPSFFDYAGAYFTDPRLSFIGAGVDLLGRTGAATAPYTENFLKTISQGGDSFIAKAGQFLFEDAANVAAKINAGTSFDELTPFEKLAIASVPAEVIPGLGLAPDILKLGRNFVINLGDDAVKLLDNYMVSKQAVTDTGTIMPMDNKPARVRNPSDYFGGIVGSKPTIIDINNKSVAKVLEDFRTGNISKIEAATILSDLIPRSGLLGKDITAPAGVKVDTKFNKVFDEYLNTNKFDDIYSTEIYRSTGGKNIKFPIAPQRINAILKAKRIADADTSDVSYYVKFNNALKDFFPRAKTEETYNAADNVFFTKASSAVLDEARSIFKYLNKTDKKVDVDLLTKPKTVKTTGFDLWNKMKINSDEPIKGETLRYAKANVYFDGSNQTFSQIKKELLNNNEFVADKIKKTKDLFVDKTSKDIFALDHIQPLRFGGTNLESNLRIIPQGEHLTLKKLSPSDTKAVGAVKAKTGFEDDFFKEGVAIIDLIQKGNVDEAIKRSSKLDAMVDDFKSVYENTDFVVGEPHFAVKTGDRTGSFVKYSDKLNLTSEQKKVVNQIFNKPEYSNRPNLGKSIEKQSEELLNTYEDIALLSDGKIGKNISKQFLRFNKGGIADMEYMTRPLDGQR